MGYVPIPHEIWMADDATFETWIRKDIARMQRERRIIVGVALVGFAAVLVSLILSNL